MKILNDTDFPLTDLLTPERTRTLQDMDPTIATHTDGTMTAPI